jgi:hypothetical protein
MSTTTVYGVWPDEKKVEEIAEYGNAWHSAPLLWDGLANRYLGVDSFMFHADRLWKLAKDARLSRAQRAVLTLTFDNAIIMAEDYDRAANDIKEMMGDLLIGGHWVRIADLLASKPDSPAIGFYWTSVSENPFDGGWTEDEEGDEVEVPLDYTKFWSVYEEASLKETTDVGATA